MIGYSEWQADFAGSPGVIGTNLRLNGIEHMVVGVMPEGFRFPVDQGYWRPLTGTGDAYAPDDSPSAWVFGRLAPGVGRAGATAEMEGIAANLRAEYPDTYETLRPTVHPYIRHLFDVQQYSPWYFWLLQLVGALLFGIVAVNVAVLVFARTATRQAEITVRTALGATRGRIVGQLFLEALALGIGAAALGLVIAAVGWRQMSAIPDLRDSLPHWLLGRLPTQTILYAAGLAVLSAFVVGVLPALRATGRELQGTLRQLGGATGIAMGRTWTLLIVVQVAVAVAGLPTLAGVVLSPSVVGVGSTPNFPAEETLSFRLLAVSFWGRDSRPCRTDRRSGTDSG